MKFASLIARLTGSRATTAPITPKPRATPRKAAPDATPDDSRAQWLARGLQCHDAGPGHGVPRYSPPGFPAPIWSAADLSRTPQKAPGARRTPRPIYGPEYNHRAPSKAATARALARAAQLDATPRHAPENFPFPVWSDSDVARWQAWRDANAMTGRGPGAGALKARAAYLAPWQKKGTGKGREIKGGR